MKRTESFTTAYGTEEEYNEVCLVSNENQSDVELELGYLKIIC